MIFFMNFSGWKFHFKTLLEVTARKKRESKFQRTSTQAKKELIFFSTNTDGEPNRFTPADKTTSLKLLVIFRRVSYECKINKSSVYAVYSIKVQFKETEVGFFMLSHIFLYAPEIWRARYVILFYFYTAPFSHVFQKNKVEF